ncbi:hypothetical protein POV27_09005 [Aureisphaera galaxeae]|uniref:hypothetical protein n=1 Tax=Aureisphaera galaxeae TaxID=1538023 RepID=UPI002351048B|nr:hypothetical protein [Aureisphaera galaxeae]MDC8004187.1 hypothetical protein [Aureisphaera galaxeae]
MKTPKFLKILCVFLSLLMLSSCYSVRMKVTNGFGPELDDTGFDDEDNEDPARGQLFRTIDTIITVKTTTDENPVNIDACESGALHTVEYRSTFGGVLLYLVTFGRKRKMKVKYVCVKDQG